MREQVAGWVEAGRPNVSGSISNGSDIQFETDNVQVNVLSEPRSLGFFEAPNTIATLAWFDSNRLVARLDEELTAEAGNDAEALSDVDRQKAEAEILGDLLANEREEVALIDLAGERGTNISYRSDTNPMALLGVQLVTQGRPTLLSRVSNAISVK